MHSFQSKRGTVFIYNGDCSGGMEIFPIENSSFKIDGKDFLEFARYIVAQEIISKIENEFC